MKLITTYLALIFTMPVMAENLCPNRESNVESEFRWEESDFTRESAEKALEFLSGVLLESKEYV